MSDTTSQFRSIKTSTAKVQRIHAQIVELRYDEEFEDENLESVKENIAALLELGGGKYDACLIIPSRYALPTVEGRKYIEQEMSKFPCVAVVLEGLAQKILMSFVMTVIGKTKMKIFNDEEKAVQWILEKIKEG